MDPDMGAYLTGEKGSILRVPEVRHRMVRGKPLRTVSVDTGGNLLTRTWDDLENIARSSC